ncbi:MULTISPECIES: DUF2505 domain-containing protein [Ferrimonas]|uniref:DUF2505 domain-containing protein n=1 Tax=Ferrimonas TaxID=44011 RepID=UPI0009FDA764|nr:MULTISPECIES: DUF2505 domain-containing protein [Ferrimonas]USD39518.1 DUF2505 domain-containing protein [Ferrimonas sp. SCSIO 43195]
MKLAMTHLYSCSTAELFRFFSEPDLITQKYSDIDCDNVRVTELTPKDDGLTLSTKREMESNVPSVLKRLLGARNVAKQAEQWRIDGDHYHCQMAVELVGVPIKITGTLHFAPTDSGCANHVELQLKSALPFIGNKLTRFVCDEIERMANAERDYLQQQLARETA